MTMNDIERKHLSKPPRRVNVLFWVFWGNVAFYAGLIWAVM